tara:strand:- start:111 stop:311 length:201 start_codon:yes stop_codon:yes gene_type:complete
MYKSDEDKMMSDPNIKWTQSSVIKDKYHKSIDPLIRIADTLDEILKLVKDDMAASKKRWENENITE